LHVGVVAALAKFARLSHHGSDGGCGGGETSHLLRIKRKAGAMTAHKVLIDGMWRPANVAGTFQAENPATKSALADVYPVSTWADCNAALDAATRAFAELSQLGPERIARFLEQYADRIEQRSGELVAMAVSETALAASPRLAEVELPRTTGQLRQAAAAARELTWATATIDSKLNIRSCLEPLGPVWVFGPNNFPFAFNSVSGGDFAAAIATGCPVIAKANTSHPGTTRLLAEEAFAALQTAELPRATVQLIYRTSHTDGARAVSDPRTGASAYTGSRSAGLALKRAADATGKPIYLELSSINPVAILPGALRERGDQIAAEFVTSCLMGTGQFCTNPGMVVLLAGAETDRFIAQLVEKFNSGPVGTLLSRGVAQSLQSAVQTLTAAGAELLAGGAPANGAGHSFANTLLRVSATQFLADGAELQTEAFGNASLLVIANDSQQARQVLEHAEGNLTGCIYSDTQGSDDALYDQLAPALRQRVGRLLNDKMPTGVAVSPAMNHGGPYPATGHPGFTAVGIPGSLHRFGALRCYDNVRPDRLPSILQDRNPTGATWRFIDGRWTQDDVGGK
jgi:2,5-dioxopentanoate dehydrogenase